MKGTPAPLVAHQAQTVTTLSYIARLNRHDGMVLGVTLDHDEPIPFESETYTPIYGLIPSSMETTAALNVDNLDAAGALMSLGVNESEIQAGLWDMCEVRVMRVNWKDPSMGCEKLKRGWFGQISHGDSKFTNEIRTLTQKLQSRIGGLLSPLCDADLFDARCGKPKIEGVNQFSGVAVSTIIAPQRQFTAAALTQAAGFFDGGTAIWTSGANINISREIKAHLAGGNIELHEPTPYPIAALDQATFLAGCLKRETEDCKDKHNNVLRFRGYDKLPGQDQVFKGV